MELTLFFAVVTVMFAYFVKSATGFGPALIMIPIFSILFNPKQAIVLSTLFDSIAGLILLATIYKKINWPFIIPVMLFLNAGIYLGASLMVTIPSSFLFILIGGILLVFAVFIFFNKNTGVRHAKHKTHWGSFVALFSGFLGGLTGISGPLLVSYFKLSFDKKIFRDSLIAVFAFAAVWRLAVYFYFEIPWEITGLQLGLFLIAMLVGLFLGKMFNQRVNELTFNKIVAIILLVPAFNMLLRNVS